MNKTKIFTIGSATFDMFLRPNDQEVMQLATDDGSVEKFLCLNYGAKVKVDEVHETFGGGAANTAVGLARMGFDVYPVVMIGEHYSEKVVHNLLDNGVNTNFVHITPKDKTSFSVILNIFDGDRTVLAYPGANQYLTKRHLPLAELATADWIYLGHLASYETDIPEQIIQLMNKNPNIQLAWNPGHEQFLNGAKKWKRLLKHTDVLILNKEEASEFTGKPFELANEQMDQPQCHVHATKGFLPHYADDVSEIMLELLSFGVKNVVITDGRNGAQASNGKHWYFCPVETLKRVDSLGAGDAFATGFIGALAMGNGLKTGLIYGTLNASSVVSCYGAQEGLLKNKPLQSALKKTQLCVNSTKLSK